MSHHHAAGRLLSGGREIAAVTGLKVRQVFHHAEAGRLPCFRIGRTIVAREDAVRSWLDEQEAAGKLAPRDSATS